MTPDFDFELPEGRLVQFEDTPNSRLPLEAKLWRLWAWQRNAAAGRTRDNPLPTGDRFEWPDEIETGFGDSGR